MKKSLILLIATLAISYPALATAQESPETQQEAPETIQETPEEAQFAPITVEVRINALGQDLFFDEVVVTEPCAYEETSSSTSASALCALRAASAQGGFAIDVPWSDFGYFVDAIADHRSDHGRYVYWTLFKGTTPSEQGIALTSIAQGDSILLTYDTYLMRIVADNLSPAIGATSTITAQYFDLSSWPWEWKTALDAVFSVNGAEASSTSGTIEFVATSTDPVSIAAMRTGYIEADPISVTAVAAQAEPAPQETPAPSSGGSSGGSAIEAPRFDLSKAIDFIKSKQRSNGSFGADIYDDWAAIGLAAAGETPKALKEKILSSSLQNPAATDHERRAMALFALGVYPQEHLDAISNSFDGEQIGEQDLINDDIFALFPLYAASQDPESDIVARTASHIRSRQLENGSWENSVDLTSAAIQALSLYPSSENAATTERAKLYLKEAQGSDACFGNSSATAWALQAIAALNENQSAWSKGSLTPLHCLSNDQQEDGGLSGADENSRIWATSYAIPASTGKTWASILQKIGPPKASAGRSASRTIDLSLNAATETAPALVEDDLSMTLRTIEELTGLTGETIIVIDEPRIESSAQKPVVSAQEDIKPASLPQTQTASVAESIRAPAEPVTKTVLRGFRIMKDRLLDLFE